MTILIWQKKSQVVKFFGTKAFIIQVKLKFKYYKYSFSQDRDRDRDRDSQVWHKNDA